MIKTIKIVGVGDRRQGTSKTGKAYDFTPVSFCFEKPWIKGYSAATCNVNQDCMGDYVPAVNDEKQVVMHEDFRTGALYIDAFM